MKQQSFFFLFAALLITVSAFTQNRYSSKSFQITVAGTSNVHDWTSKATAVNVSGDFNLSNTGVEKINTGVVKIETKSIKSTKNSDIMDSRTYSTLKADAHPQISYVFTKLLNVQQSGSETIMTVNGNLTIAGVTKPTDLVLRIKTLPNGDLEIKGSRKILMSNHGVKPPSFMLGAMKVGDEINITYDIILKKI